MTEAIPINSNHPLVGQWKPTDDFSDLVVSIVAEANGFSVSAIDEADGESAEIFDPKYDGDVLSFAAHWVGGGNKPNKLRKRDKMLHIRPFARR